MTKKHNGWTNYETWVVNLWMSNDANAYEFWREQARRHKENVAECDVMKDDVWADAAAVDLAEQLKADAEEGRPEIEASVYADLLTAALSEVNWIEIAKHWIADC